MVWLANLAFVYEECLSMAIKEHLKILKQGVKRWNKWREENPDVKPDLSNAAIYKETWEIYASELKSDKDRSRVITELMNSYKGVDLRNIDLRGANLDRSILIGANLRKADLRNAQLKEANLFNACLVGSELNGADLQGITLNDADLQGTVLSYVNLQKAVLSYANLQKAWLIQVNLQEASLLGAKLQGAEILSTKLQGANVSYAIVDGETWIDETAKVDRRTNFEGVGLDSMRIDPGIKQLLEYAIRRRKWESWYSGKSQRSLLVVAMKCLKVPVRCFWWMSDYGLSTGRIILSFSVLAVAFATVYSLWPSCVMVNNVVGDIRGFVHALYFSVVTMTTLGFGDIAANPDSWFGQVALILQVILGYVHLGALVTRFAVVFTAGGPAGRFSAKQNEGDRTTPETS